MLNIAVENEQQILFKSFCYPDKAIPHFLIISVLGASLLP